MIKKKVLLITLACALAMTNAVPVFAAEAGTNKVNVDKQAKIQEKLVKLNEKAQKLGLDITGLSLTDAKAKIQTAVQANEEAKAEKLGVDIKGLSHADAKAKLQAAAQEKKQARAVKQAAKKEKQAAKVQKQAEKNSK